MTDERRVTARQLIGDVQRFGLISAATVVDRYARLADEDQAGPVADLDGTVARLAQVYVSFLRTAADMVASLPPAPPGGGERILFPSGHPGATVEAELWLHNPTPLAIAEVHMTASDLVGSQGAFLPGSAISLSPSVISRLDAGASQRLSIRVEVPDGQPAGYYHGLVVASEVPEEPVAVRLQVVEDEESCE